MGGWGGRVGRGRGRSGERPASAKALRQGLGLAPSRSSRGHRAMVGGQREHDMWPDRWPGPDPREAFALRELWGLGAF